MTNASAIIDRINAKGSPDQLATLRQLIDLDCRDRFMPFLQRSFGTVAAGAQFQANWHIEAIAHRLERVARGDCRRLIIAMPPRSLKSVCASVAFPAWLLGLNPSHKIVCISYAQDLADKHARDCRTVMESDWYRDVFPRTTLDRRKAGVGEFATTDSGSRLATSIGGTLTGRGGDVVIIDDPLKPQDAMSEVQRTKTNAWYDGTLLSRLDDKSKGAIVIVTQRLHLDDLVGHVQDHDNWESLTLPAIAEVDEEIVIGPDKKHYRHVGDLLHPAREPQNVHDGLQVQMGSLNYSAQYQQNPIPADGEMIKWFWIRSYRHRPERQPGDLIIHSWDTASKNTELADFSVCTVWLVRGDDYYLLEVIREKLLYPDLKKRVIALKALDKPTALLIENRGSGMSLIDDLKASRLRPIAIDPVNDKVTRMSAQSAALEAKGGVRETSAWPRIRLRF